MKKGPTSVFRGLEARRKISFTSLEAKLNFTTNVFSSYQLASKLSLVYLEVKLQKKQVQLLHLVAKMPEKGRNKVFRDK